MGLVAIEGIGGSPPPSMVSEALAHARVALPLPKAVSDPLYVTIPSHGGDERWGPIPWRPDPLGGMPAAGAEVLVAFDDRGMPWLVAWK